MEVCDFSETPASVPPVFPHRRDRREELVLSIAIEVALYHDRNRLRRSFATHHTKKLLRFATRRSIIAFASVKASVETA
jgi:hypothetical protein